MAKQHRESQGQILERYRNTVQMPKTQFCDALDISRPTYDAWLTGAEISLKWLAYSAVDFVDDWRGALARELIRASHGDQFLPIGAQEETRARHDQQLEAVKEQIRKDRVTA